MGESGTLADWIHLAVVGMEVLATLIIVIGTLYGAIVYGVRTARSGDRAAGYTDFRRFVARALLLGLEVLVAADVVNTVALEPTLESVAVLGGLVIIRTFLGWSLVVEMEGRWPWQPERRPLPHAAPPVDKTPAR